MNGVLADDPHSEDSDPLREGSAEGPHPHHEPLPSPAADVAVRR